MLQNSRNMGSTLGNEYGGVVAFGGIEGRSAKAKSTREINSIILTELQAKLVKHLNLYCVRRLENNIITHRREIDRHPYADLLELITANLFIDVETRYHLKHQPPVCLAPDNCLCNVLRV